MADDLALVGDRVGHVQRRQSVEAMLVFVTLDGLVAPRLERRELAAGGVHQHGLAAGVVHEHALFRIDEQCFFHAGFDAQRAHQRFRLAEVLVLDGAVLRPAITRATR
jgi:hypothetical protein